MEKSKENLNDSLSSEFAQEDEKSVYDKLTVDYKNNKLFKSLNTFNKTLISHKINNEVKLNSANSYLISINPNGKLLNLNFRIY